MQYEKIKTSLLEALRNDQLILPTLPEIALQVREVAQSPDTDIPKLVKLIGKDAALSAGVIRVANSPLVRGPQLFDDLPNAVARLGISYSCNLAIGLAMEQMFQATNEIIECRMRETWTRSTEVATIAGVLAQAYTDIPGDEAMLAGLTHLIGSLPILAYLEENDVPIQPSETETLNRLLNTLSPVIGESMLREWKFPQKFCMVPALHNDYQRNSEEVDLVDIVIVAKLQSYGANISDNVPSQNQLPAFAKLGLNYSDINDTDHRDGL